MKDTFVFIETGARVDPDLCKEYQDTMQHILAREVIVKTPDMTGSGVVLRDTIITSLFLVRNFSEVSIRFTEGKKMPAFVTSRDERSNLAKLRPACLESMESPNSIFGSLTRKLSSRKLDISGPQKIGAPLFVLNSRSGVPHIKVAAMFYRVRVGERWENSWKIDPLCSHGLMGSALWDECGKLTGVSLAARAPLPNDLEEASRITSRKVRVAKLEGPRMYAAPANAVLDFAETN